jgi:ankyrin repeat protein
MAIVQLLLDTGKVRIDSKDSEPGSTPQLWASCKGHETGKARTESRDIRGETPLIQEAENERTAVVDLLLETGKAEADLANAWNGQTSLFLASIWARSYS